MLQLKGDISLLLSEREVHQLARLRGMAPLRLDAVYSSGPWFGNCLPPGWITGNFDLPGKDQPLHLLEERVIDAWIGSYQPDLPDPDHPTVSRMWMRCVSRAAETARRWHRR